MNRPAAERSPTLGRVAGEHCRLARCMDDRAIAGRRAIVVDPARIRFNGDAERAEIALMDAPRWPGEPEAGTRYFVRPAFLDAP